MVGPFSNICLGQCRITEPMNQCCDCKGHDFHSHVLPPPICTTGNRRGVKMKLRQGRDQLPLSSCFPSAKQCVVKGLQPCKGSQKLRVQACQSSTNALWDVPPLLGGAWSAAGKWHSRYCLSGLAMMLCLGERVTEEGCQDTALTGTS